MTARPLLLSLCLGAFGCTTQPCDDYVDYVCQCHEQDTGFDCDEIRTIYAEATPEVQDQCAIELDKLQSDDKAAGLECEVQ